MPKTCAKKKNQITHHIKLCQVTVESSWCNLQLSILDMKPKECDNQHSDTYNIAATKEK